MKALRIGAFAFLSSLIMDSYGSVGDIPDHVPETGSAQITRMEGPKSLVQVCHFQRQDNTSMDLKRPAQDPVGLPEAQKTKSTSTSVTTSIGLPFNTVGW